MKSIKTGLLLLIIAAGLMLSSQPAQAQDCVFQLGFKTLRDLIPNVVGDCLENEQHNPYTGSARQPTTNGFLFWRKADNWTGFSDGTQTAINGPQGLQWRLTTERFPWETATSAGAEAHRLTLEQLRNGEYRLPLLSDEETAIRFEDGQGSIKFGEGATEQVRAGLIDDIAAFGDLDSDGLADAAVLVFVDPGGSGTFVNLIAMVDRGGAPVQAAREFLGDRVRAQSLTISGGEIVVTMLTHGPDDGLCCPSLTVTRKFRLADGGLGLVPTQTLVVEASPDDQQPRLTLEHLRNGEYRLPLLGDEETPIRFDDGQALIKLGEGATERVHAGLVDDIVAFGDLDDRRDCRRCGCRLHQLRRHWYVYQAGRRPRPGRRAGAGGTRITGRPGAGGEHDHLERRNLREHVHARPRRRAVLPVPKRNPQVSAASRPNRV